MSRVWIQTLPGYNTPYLLLKVSWFWCEAFTVHCASCTTITYSSTFTNQSVVPLVSRSSAASLLSEQLLSFISSPNPLREFRHDFRFAPRSLLTSLLFFSSNLSPFFVLYHPVAVTLHSSCHSLIRDHSLISLLPLSHCQYILVYSSFHILSTVASFWLLYSFHLFVKRHLCVFLKALTLDSTWRPQSPFCLFSLTCHHFHHSSLLFFSFLFHF